MSEENVEKVRRGTEYVVAKREPDTTLFDPDIVWDVTTFPGVYSEPLYGIQAVREFFRDWLEGFDDYSIQIEELLDAGDQVVLIATQHGTSRHGADVEMRFGQVFTFREGLVTRSELYATPEGALEAAGLSE